MKTILKIFKRVSIIFVSLFALLTVIALFVPDNDSPDASLKKKADDTLLIPVTVVYTPDELETLSEETAWEPQLTEQLAQVTSSISNSIIEIHTTETSIVTEAETTSVASSTFEIVTTDIASVTVEAATTNVTPIPVETTTTAVVPTTTEAPVVTEEITTTDPNDNILVWLSASGEKYHSIDHCGRMDPKKARQVTKSYAISRGYEPCDKCY